ncbi:chemotaxis protein CheA [Candidatus Sumerlaeota bacterium]|nr:chemotaxis protein CheA [Candidatus Sumerlaeota bacterium]
MPRTKGKPGEGTKTDEKNDAKANAKTSAKNGARANAKTNASKSAKPDAKAQNAPQNEELPREVEALAEALVLLEPSDVSAMAEAHTSLQKIVESLKQEKQERFAEATHAAAQLVEKIILADTDEPDAAMATLLRFVAALQAAICNGREEAECDFPVELMPGGAVEQPAPEPEPEPEAPKAKSGLEDSTTQLPPAAPQAAPVKKVEAADARQAQTETTGPSDAQTALEADRELLSEFLSGEAQEHLEAADMGLLELETDPSLEEALNAVFRAFHTIKGVAGFLGLTQIGSLAHEAENLLDSARKGELVLKGAAIDATFDAVDGLKKLITEVSEALATGVAAPANAAFGLLIERIQAAGSGEALEEDQGEPEGVPGRRLGEILVESGSATNEQVESALQRQRESDEHPKLGSVLARDEKVPARDVAHALRSQQQASAVKENVKVDAERLDRLLDTIGELVIVEAMVTQSPEMKGIASAELARHLSQLNKITRELQEMGIPLRMIPLRSTFQKMARMVRDLSKKAGKRVEFCMSGEDTELDKSVVDKIGDPLVHMIRNAVDHGLESDPAERRAAGKSETGRVELRAYHKGGGIYIEIEDDGRGLNKDAILAKARDRKLINDGDSLSEREIFNLIFEPGFSTAKKITEVSGRGVGMDVVRRNIEALRGQVDIQSKPGKGSVFSIRLPLTLAIIDGMVVRAGQERYIIPTLSVVRSIRPEKQHRTQILSKGELLSVQGELIPLFRLGELFGIAEAESELTNAIAIIVEEENRRVAILADELLGQQQIVIKSLGEAMKGIPGIAGGAIMPDGKVGLIVDVSGLTRFALTENKEDEIDTKTYTDQEAPAELSAGKA